MGSPGASSEVFNYDAMITQLDAKSQAVMEKVSAVQNQDGGMNIADMFQVQVQLNSLSQYSDMCSNLIFQVHTVMAGMASKLRG